MKKQHQDCKGCKIKEEGTCDLSSSLKERKCPCQICLVKGICMNYCKEFNQYANDYYNFIRI